MTPTETAAILRHFNEWRRCDEDIPQPDTREIGEAIDAAVEMIERLEAAESDALEQARLNGMGASREAALMAKLEAAEKERDAQRVDKATLQQMLYSIKNRLEAAERSDAESVAMYRKARDERDALRAAVRHEADCMEAAMAEIKSLRAKIEQMERPESGFRERCTPAATAGGSNRFPLYALPGAQPAPSVPDGVAEALQRLIENGAVLGPASSEDALLVARYRQRLLACAPSVPDGWQLVPTAESRHPGIYKMLGAPHAVDNTPGASEWASYAAFLAAAPGAQPAPFIPEGWKLVPIVPQPTALLVAAADLVAQMEIVSRVGFIDTPSDKDSCAAFCIAEGTWLELMSCVKSLASALAAAPEVEP